MRFSQCGQLPPGSLRSVYSAGGDLFQGSVDFFVKRAAFLVGPAFFSVQGFQGAADHVLSLIHIYRWFGVRSHTRIKMWKFQTDPLPKFRQKRIESPNDPHDEREEKEHASRGRGFMNMNSAYKTIVCLLYTSRCV